MRKNNAKDLAIDIAGRSICRVKVGSVLADRHGIYSWGWNHIGSGFGCCAETTAILRANPKRLAQSSIYVAGYHRKTGNPCPAKPCSNCAKLIEAVRIHTVNWHGKNGWESYDV